MLLAVALLVAVGRAAPAWAHVELTATSPAADAVVADPVAAVSLTFGGPVQGRYTTVSVTAGGQSFSDGAVQVIDTTVTQPVRALPGGEVTVTWRTVAADGDPLQGSFTFVVDAGDPTAAGVGDAAAAPPADPGGPTIAAERAAGGTGGWGLLITAGIMLLAAAAVTLGWPWRQPVVAAIRGLPRALSGTGRAGAPRPARRPGPGR